MALTLGFANVRQKSVWIGATVCLGCILAMVWIARWQVYQTSEMLSVTPLTQFLKMVLLALTMVVAVLSFGAQFSRHIGEYFRPPAAGGGRPDASD